jgi:hypothetical protein
MNFSIGSTERTYDSLDFDSDDSEFEGAKLYENDENSKELIYISTNMITEEV